VADAGVEDVPVEFDALGFQLRAGGGDIVDVEGQVGVPLPGELARAGRRPRVST
jgi:hypothetical protein